MGRHYHSCDNLSKGTLVGAGRSLYREGMIPIADAVRYVLSPHYISRRTVMDGASAGHLLILLFITICLGIVVSGLVGGVITIIMGEIPENVNGTLAETDARQLIILGVLIAPLMEELIFRSWLGFPRSSVLGFPAMICVLVLLAMWGLGTGAALFLPVAMGLGLLIFLLVQRYGRLSAAEQAVARHRLFPVAFWGTILTFGVIHLSNYEGGMAGALANPILFLAIVPQIIAGAVLGYVRMRFGLMQAIFFHMVYNAVLISLALLAVNQTPPAEAFLLMSENQAFSRVPLLQTAGPLP